MSDETASAEERIVLATISCVEKQGIENVTIRSIAKEAGVNSAAINYYFRSKENLIARAMSTTLNHFFEDWEQILGEDSKSLAERVRDLLDYFLEGAVRFPGVTKAHIYASYRSEAGESPFKTMLNQALGQLYEKIKGQSKAKNAREIALSIVQLLSAAMLPAMMPTIFEGFSGLDFRDNRTRKTYVDLIVRALPL